MFSFWELVDTISEDKLSDLLWGVAAVDEGERDADAEDEGGDSVDEGNQRWEGRSWRHFRQWKHDVVHDAIESYSEESAVEPWVARQWDLTSGEEEDGGGAEGDEEVADQADERGAVPHGEGRAAVDAAGDALKDSDGGYAAETVEDEGVRDVQCANKKSGTGDDLPERGVIG